MGMSVGLSVRISVRTSVRRVGLSVVGIRVRVGVTECEDECGGKCEDT